MVRLVAVIDSFGASLGVASVLWNEVQVQYQSWKMLADWLDGVPAVLQALSVHLEMMALVLESAEGGTFETHHYYHGGDHILATVAHTLDIIGLPCWLVANSVSC